MEHPEMRYSPIALLQGGENERARLEFVTLYEPFHQYPTRRPGFLERHLAKVVQQILLAIAKAVDGWANDGGTASFRHWPAAVARNIAMTFLRKERR